jgi:monovalent cation:H+ antiporter-2, CPA2 family
MNAFQFIQDLAVIMLIAGIITVVCHLLKQPAVLGYILAGIIIGPYTPPFSLIHNQEIINTLAELGIIFIMFSLGLDFNIHKLKRVGRVAFISALIEIVLMLMIGYSVGRMFQWTPTHSLMLGAMIAISSTTIILKAVDDLGIRNKHYIQIILGILIFEDIFGIIILSLLSSTVITGGLQLNHIIASMIKLIIFLLISLFFGLHYIPKAISSLAKFKSEELLLISVLGFCFGFCLLVIKLGYSMAWGAFIIGSIIAESREHAVIERLVQPLKHMFSAIFFVSVGLLFNPKALLQYAFPIFIVTVVVIIGKFLTGTLGTFIAGQDLKTSFKVGAGLTQIGEFSLIIIALGLSFKIIDPFLYPIAVAVSFITTVITPIFLRHSTGFSQWCIQKIPTQCLEKLNAYTHWIEKGTNRVNSHPDSVFMNTIFQIVLYLSYYF